MAGKAVVVTGTLESMSRDKAVEAVKARGGSSPGSVSKKTAYLVAGAEPGQAKVTKAEECGVPVAALIDAAAAASARPFPERQLVYVDAGLHRVSVTPVEQADGAVAGLEHGFETTGLVTVQDLIARWIAETFVLVTRFDPFHQRCEISARLNEMLTAG